MDREGEIEFSARAVAVETAIRDAFRGVTRVGGVSWLEAYAIDGCDISEEPPETDVRWEDLVDDPAWDDTDACCGGLCFMDPIGYRYYVPAMMIRCLRGRGGSHLGGRLQMLGDSGWKKRATFTQAQAVAVASFLVLMVARDVSRGDTGSEWQHALDSYWGRFA